MQLISKGRPLFSTNPCHGHSQCDAGLFQMVAASTRLIWRWSCPRHGGRWGHPYRYRWRVDLPGAPDVSEQEELDRVIPVVERMVAELDVMISLDTSKAAVMREGCAAGGHLINDVRACKSRERWARRPRLAYRYASCTCRAAPYHAGGAAP